MKKACPTCGEQHLLILHEAATVKSVLTVSTSSSVVYLDQATHSGRVILKVVPVKLHSEGRTLDTHAILDDGSERTIILPAAAHYLGLKRMEESLTLRTIRQEVIEVKGVSVSFEVSAPEGPQVRHKITKAFTARELTLAKQSCPMDTLKQKYAHLKDIPVKSFKEVQPMLLIGSDYPQLIIPTSPVR